jgi:mannose-6-phosphate isomerase-like protein (cupin superfamily)
MKISTQEALNKLKEKHQPFFKLFEFGNLEVEMYKPAKVDLQKPHDKDEFYIIVSGTGDFYNDGETQSFRPGDFLFVAAGKEHRFLNFTDDFATWVFFFGPQGGFQVNDDKNELVGKI